jgi:hypothetical protein
MATSKKSGRPDAAANDYATRRASRMERLAELAKQAQPSSGISQRIEPVPRPSRAPAPIEPVKNGANGIVRTPSRHELAAKWNKWKLIPKCPLWKAVCLSLDLEPSGDSATVTRWLRYDHDLIRLADVYAERLEVAQANVSTNGPLHPQALYVGALTSSHVPVLLSEFAVVAIGWGWAVPDEMRALAEVAGDVNEKRGAATSQTARTGNILNKRAFIAKYKDEWQTIDADFNHASENGLSKEAKAPLRGEWFEEAALKWADKKGKRQGDKNKTGPNSVFALSGKKHTIK